MTGSRRLKGLLALSAALLLWSTEATIASAEGEPCGSSISCYTKNDGIDTSSTRQAVSGLAKGPADDGKSPWAPAADAPRYEYGGTTSCTNARPGETGAESMCMAAVTACSNPANGPGPLTRIWRRIIQPGQPPTPWQLIGTTCWADAVPGSRPTLTMAMILEAFHNTPWAKPEITTQPAGNTTLVGLDTYYKVNWTSEGFQPEEVDPIDPSRMNGYHVDIRVKLANFIWVFGDGQTFGPTKSEGGVYPSGDITHQYQSGGAYGASVNTTFAGEFRIDGGEWAPIPDTVTVPGPATTVTVRTAQAQLVDH